MPKRGPSSTGGQPSKRVKQAREETPAEPGYADCPFEIVYPSRGLRNIKKAPSKHEPPRKYIESQNIPFVARDAVNRHEMDIEYAVSPYEDWAAMRKYTNFIIQQETYTNSECVYVKSVKVGNDPKSFWIARILQVRAKDAQHVYALVTWMYWPEELPVPRTKALDQVNGYSGMRKYHANNELIASNYLDVLDVLSFAGKAEIIHWDEEGDTPPKTLFWRQTLNQKADQLSAIRQHCICKKPWNPDLQMYICDNPKCKTMLHPSCLTDLAARKKYEEVELTMARVEEGTQGAAMADGAKKKATVDNIKAPTRGEWSKRFRAELVVTGGQAQAKMMITDLDGGKEGPKKTIGNGNTNGSANGLKKPTKWEESIICPICEHTIE